MTKSAGTFKEGQFNLSFPILSNPVSIFSLLVGQDIDLLQLQFPKFGFQASIAKQFRVPSFPIVGVELAGTFKTTVDIGFGMDTYGIRQFLGPKSSQLAERSVLEDHEKVRWFWSRYPRSYIDCWSGLSAFLDAVFVSAKVGGGIYAQVDLNLHDNNDDGKVRVDEIIENAKETASVGGLEIPGNLYLRCLWQSLGRSQSRSQHRNRSLRDQQDLGPRQHRHR